METETADAPAAEILFQLFAYEVRGDDSFVNDIMEVGNPRTLDWCANVTHGLDRPAAPDAKPMRYELLMFQHTPGVENASRDLGKWPVERALTPPRCRKPRACVVVDGVPVDLVKFALARLRAA